MADTDVVAEPDEEEDKPTLPTGDDPDNPAPGGVPEDPPDKDPPDNGPELPLP